MAGSRLVRPYRTSFRRPFSPFQVPPLPHPRRTPGVPLYRLPGIGTAAGLNFFSYTSLPKPCENTLLPHMCPDSPRLLQSGEKCRRDAPPLSVRKAASKKGRPATAGLPTGCPKGKKEGSPRRNPVMEPRSVFSGVRASATRRIHEKWGRLAGTENVRGGFASRRNLVFPSGAGLPR